MSVSDVVPILSDADPPITYEPSAPTAPSTGDNGVIKVSLEVICCPCPKDDCAKPGCDCDKCDQGCFAYKSGCAHPVGQGCCANKCEKCGARAPEEEATPNFCRRWFPYLSHFCC